MKRCELLIVSFLITSSVANAQMGDDAIFLQGEFIEVAISDCGVYGTAEDPPVGPYGDYHEIDWNGLGFVADHEQDGWDVSTGSGEPDFCGDYFAPGSPEEGWAIQIGSDIWENHYIGCYGYGSWFGGSPDIEGDVTEYVDGGTYKKGVWEGEIIDGSINISIKQTTTFPNDALYFVTEVEICNNGTADITDLYYMRNVDPDQDLDQCGTFNTENEVVYNPPDDDTALVTAVGAACGCFLGIGAIDCRARVSYGNFFISPATPEGGWNGDISEGYYDSGDIDCDCGIQISFKVDIAAGYCETISFTHVLDPSDLVEALSATGTVFFAADGVELDTAGTTVEKCVLDTLTLEILNAEQYDWYWSPSYGLSADTGSSVLAYPAITTTYYISGYSICDSIFDSITVEVHDVEGNANAGPDTYVCPDDTITLEGSGGVTYLWQPPVYLEDPTNPNTAVLNPQTDMYYFLIAFDELGCPDTASVYIDLRELPEVDAGPDKVMALGTFTQLSGSGAETYSWTPASTLSDSTVYNPIASPTDTTQYFLTGWDAFGCENLDSMWVYVIDPAYIENPNVFSPNEDGINDFYIPHVEGLGELIDYQIYSRWGDMVYDWNPGDRGWDGTYLGKRQEVATYIVVITAYDSVKRAELEKIVNVILLR
jgi:gliding motility-associated-like protein